MKNGTLTSALQPATRHERDSIRLVPPGLSVKTLVAATAVALLVLPGVRTARAQTIGDIDVRSRIGERFFAAVPVRSDAVLDPNCIRVGANPAAPEGSDRLSGTRVHINPTGAVESVIIETTGSVTSPVIALRLEVGCTNPVVRDYVVLSEGAPLQVESALPPAVPASTLPAATRIALPHAARTSKTRASSPPPTVRSAGSGRTATPRAAVVTPYSNTPPTVGSATGSAAPSMPVAAPTQNEQRRIADLRARSDNQAASLLDLEDRLTLLQKQAELLKAQLEQVLATPTAGTPASAATVATATAPTALTTPVSTTSETSASAVRKTRGIGAVLSDWRVIGGGLGALLCAAVAYTLGRSTPAGSARTPTNEAAVRQKPLRDRAQSAAQKSIANDRAQPTGTALPASDPKRATQRGKTSRQLTADADITTQWDARPPTTNTHPVPESAARNAATATHPGMDVSREFHITQQFQPTAERTVALSTPEEIVQQARTLYMDDGDIFQAIDLLEMAVSVRTDSTESRRCRELP